MARSAVSGRGSTGAWRSLVLLAPLAMFVASLALAPWSGPPAHAQDPPSEDDPAPLCQRIDELALDAHERLRVDLGIALIDLESGDTCEVRPTRIFRSASLYKLVVLAEAHRQQEELGFDFEETIELLPRHSLDDPLSLQLTEPLELPRIEAIERMITFSDNPSAEALRELLGVGFVAQAPAWLGLDQTSLGQIFFTSPRDMGQFFSALYAGSIVSPEASQAMLDLLLQQEINDLIPIGVEDGIAIAHKTGLLERHLHDAGIVFSPAGDYVLVALTEHQEDIDAAYEAVHALSTLVYEGYAETPAPLFVAPPPELTLPGSSGVVEPTATPTPQPTPVEARPTPQPTPVEATPIVEATPPPDDTTAAEGSTGLRTLLILGAAGAVALAAVSLIMLAARQRHGEPY